MASVSGSVAADERHSLPSHSKDHMMDTKTSQDADRQVSNEHNAHPWITVTKRANERRQLQPHTVPTQQLPSTPSEPALRQSRPKTRLPRLPSLPAKDYKLAIRHHGGLNLSKVSPKTLLLAVVHAANIRIHAATYDITSYGIAPDNSCKGVVNGIGHEITPDDFLTEVEVPGYEVLTCRRLGNSGAMVLTFCGKRVPFFVNAYGQALPCYLYKRAIPHCRKCNKTKHCEDVCPQPPDTPQCPVCGDSLSSNNHECHPSCMLCGGDHPTAAKHCPKRFLPPVNRRKPPRSATPTKKAQSPSPSPGRQSSASRSAARRRSRSRDKSGPKRGNSSSRSGFAGQPGRLAHGRDISRLAHGRDNSSSWPAKRFPQKSTNVVTVLVEGFSVVPEKSPSGSTGSPIIGESGVGAAGWYSEITPMVYDAVAGVEYVTKRSRSGSGGNAKTSEKRTGGTRVAGLGVDGPSESRG
ncbi:hypothetical protein HPB51_017972 [Rhipicephalus microplus]|uniref:Uncharacterized protein n=1 Tax=Rhipicephalus microplus TaxID=6941 RepID=A0A9J6D5T6_RHIMP|nr:hypothetical protein HPB51_017972 [Rhipicephalus microplus]